MTIDPEEKELFVRHREHLIDSRRLVYEQFDKAVFLLAGGGLTISLTLIEKIIPFATAESKLLLVTAWSGFTLSILSTLYSFIISQKALDNEILKIDDFLSKEDEGALARSNSATNWTRRFNKGAFVCFLVAVVTLIFFVSVNLS